jgi:hypothetical protein
MADDPALDDNTLQEIDKAGSLGGRATLPFVAAVHSHRSIHPGFRAEFQLGLRLGIVPAGPASAEKCPPGRTTFYRNETATQMVHRDVKPVANSPPPIPYSTTSATLSMRVPGRTVRTNVAKVGF